MEQGNLTPTASTYSAADLAAKARQHFGTVPEVVTTALRTAGKDKATLEEATQIVKDFLEREVN